MIRIREIDHLVLRVRDIDTMRRFYCEVLGAEHVAWRPQFGMSHLRVGRSMVDLITFDALQLYLKKLKPGGWLVYNISNRYLDLAPVLANQAEQADLAGWFGP